jgi:hypothetical protein
MTVKQRAEKKPAEKKPAENLQAKLDEALELTFPASDPVAIESAVPELRGKECAKEEAARDRDERRER